MPDCPIILAPWQVRAVQEGRLTQIRVPVVPQPADDIHPHVFPSGTTGWISSRPHQYGSQTAHICPFRPGDILYVRETWMLETEQGIPTGGYIYKASPNKPEPDGDAPLRWHSPATMPRAAARLFLTVGEVRVQRLGEMTIDDAFAEGIAWSGITLTVRDGSALPNALLMYKKYWNARYARKYPWQEGLWTFVATVTVKEGAHHDD